jgi:acyl-CoA synthetase (AMP-forming)/AMP-acid ligase II
MGISLTGAIPSLINPAYSETEIRYQVENAKSKFIFAHTSCLDKVISSNEGKLPIIVIDNNETKVDENLVKNHKLLLMSDLCSVKPLKSKYNHGEELLKNFDCDSTVTLPFSSGTTGRSKGVILTHKSVISNILQFANIEPKSIVLFPMPFFHIYGFGIALLCSHHIGSKLVFMSAFDFQLYLQLIERYKITRGYVVPPIVLSLAKQPVVDNYDLSSLKCLVSGAAPLGVEMQETCAKRLGCIVKQLWGMTELSPLGTIIPDDMFTKTEELHGSSGPLIAGTEGKIINTETGEDIDPCQEGELLIRGPQVMKGYLNNPEATANTITPDGWLKTGDIGCFDERGWLYIKDRLKELIKYKGFQVPPAELEAIIATMPEVKDVIVIPVLDEEAGEIPRAYVVKQPNCSSDFGEKDIIKFVEGHVAPYKRLRGGVRFTDAVPKSPSGKLLRRVQIDLDRAPK